MKKLLLNIYIWPAFFLVTLIGLVFLPLFLLFFIVFFRRNLSSALRRTIGVYGWVLVRAVPFMAPTKVENASGKFPKPCIIVANHNSAIDPYLFGALYVENCFVTSWPFKIPVYGPLMRVAGYINIADGWENIFKIGAERLRSGATLSIWPEGHRSRDGRLGRFRKGAFQLSYETGYPILPISIIGSDRILPPGNRLLSPGQARIILHEPIYPPKTGLPSQEAICAMRDQARETIRKSLEANRKETKKGAAERNLSPTTIASGACEQTSDVL